MYFTKYGRKVPYYELNFSRDIYVGTIGGVAAKYSNGGSVRRGCLNGERSVSV